MGDTQLRKAVRDKDEALVRALLAAGADISRGEKKLLKPNNVFGYYGPQENQITIIAIVPHPK